jgi:hypothetical protein
MVGHFVDVGDLINAVNIRFGLQAKRYTPYLKSEAYRGVMSIGIQYINIKEEEIDIDFNGPLPTFPKPCDYVGPKRIDLIKSGGDCVMPGIHTRGDVMGSLCDNQSSCNCSNSNACTCKRYQVKEMFTNFEISSNALGEFTKVLLVYYALPQSEDGSPYVPHYALDAIEERLSWKVKEMLRNKTINRQKPAFNAQEVQAARRLWKEERHKARSKLVAPSRHQLKSLGFKWVHLSNPMASALNYRVGNYYGGGYNSNTSNTF